MALVRTALFSISKAQATASQLAKTIADKTEAGVPLPALSAAYLCSHCLAVSTGLFCGTQQHDYESDQHVCDSGMWH